MIFSSLSLRSSPSPKLRKRELYREIRSHVWGTLGKKQLHGWSVPLAVTNIKVNIPLPVSIETSALWLTCEPNV